MTSTALPTVTFVPDYTQSFFSEDPSRALLGLLSRFQAREGGGDVPPAEVYTLIYNAAMSSSNLLEELNFAVSMGFLKLSDW